MRYVNHMHESHHTHEQVIFHARMRHIHLHVFIRVMSHTHTYMSHTHTYMSHAHTYTHTHTHTHTHTTNEGVLPLAHGGEGEKKKRRGRGGGHSCRTHFNIQKNGKFGTVFGQVQGSLAKIPTKTLHNCKKDLRIDQDSAISWLWLHTFATTNHQEFTFALFCRILSLL